MKKEEKLSFKDIDEIKNPDRKIKIWNIITTIWLSALLIFMTTYVVLKGGFIRHKEEFVDVDWEWNDDTDRYEVRIPGEGLYTIRTEKAKHVFLGEDFYTYCVFETRKSILGKITRKEITSFYINIYAYFFMEEEE